MSTQRRNIARAAALLTAVLAVAAGCAKPVLAPRDNPLDTNGTNYYDPGLVLLSGPTRDTVISQTDVTYRWRGTGRASSFTWRMEFEDWVPWSAQDSVQYHFLDDGTHLFMVYARAAYGGADPPTECRFSVAAVAAPALLVYPWQQRGGAGSFFFLQLLAKGTGPIGRARFALLYDSTALRYTGFYPHAGCWPSPSIADSSQPGLIDVIIQQFPGGSGTIEDTLASVLLVPRTLHALDSLSFVNPTALWDIHGVPVSLTTVRGCRITSGP